MTSRIFMDGDHLFCSERCLDDFGVTQWRWSVSSDDNISSQRICSTHDITDIIGTSKVFKDDSGHSILRLEG